MTLNMLSHYDYVHKVSINILTLPLNVYFIDPYTKTFFEFLELVSSKRFGEDICHLLIGRPIDEINLSILDMILDEVMVHLNVFGACMKHWISGYLQHTLIITI